MSVQIIRGDALHLPLAGELAKAAHVDKPPPVIDGQLSLLEGA